MIGASNIYGSDARDESLPIFRVGKAYVAKRGNARLRIFWLGSDTKSAVAWLEAVAQQETKEAE